MRSRNIKPGFFKDEDLVECSIPARLLATGLWMLADREGRLFDKPRQIKMEIFPADNLDIEQLLLELHIHKHIIRYEIDGVKCIQIRGFTKHQSPHFTEKASAIPAPILEDFQKKSSSSEDIPEALPPDSLIPDSLIPDCSPNGECAGTEKIAPLPPWIDAEVWKNFKLHRKLIRKPVNPLVQKLTITELEKLKALGNEPNAVLNQSIQRGYTGVFPIDENKPNRKTNPPRNGDQPVPVRTGAKNLQELHAAGEIQ